MLDNDRRRSGRGSIGGFVLGIGVLGIGIGLSMLVGCTEANGPDRIESASNDMSKETERLVLDRNELDKKILEIAILVGDDFYMIPQGIDEFGCEMFGPYSTRNATLTAIHYRQADGSFNVVRDPAICKVDMVAMGPDEAGCEWFRAEPVNPVLSPTEVVYYRDDQGNYVVHKPRSACS